MSESIKNMDKTEDECNKEFNKYLDDKLTEKRIEGEYLKSLSKYQIELIEEKLKGLGVEIK